MASRLSNHLSLPLISLDRLFFGPTWRSLHGPVEWLGLQEALCAGESWIIDGNYADSLSPRLARADAIILLDRSPMLCLFRYLWRTAHLARAPSSALPVHMLSDAGGRRVAHRPIEFVTYILAFRRKVLPGMVQAIRERPHIPCMLARTDREVAELDSISNGRIDD
jgi:hypothetical protein